MDKNKGVIFNIERYATEDGPGIRTVVFLKGCLLSCKWCANPESQNYYKEIMYHSNLCIGCKKCIDICPCHAINVNKTFGLVTDFNKCIKCGKCIDGCLSNARELMGKYMSVSEVLEEVRKDEMFYEQTGGGITLSGGEPFAQGGFLEGILRECKKVGINTTVETCGFAKWEDIDRCFPYIDLIYYDLKHINSDKHKELTGSGNELVLNNLRRISTKNIPIIIRIPYIPGYNSDINNHKELFKYISNLDNIQKVEVLPYHRFGLGKYRGLGRKYELELVEPVKKEQLCYLTDIGKRYDLDVDAI